MKTEENSTGSNKTQTDLQQAINGYLRVLLKNQDDKRAAEERQKTSEKLREASLVGMVTPCPRAPKALKRLSVSKTVLSSSAPEDLSDVLVLKEVVESLKEQDNKILKQGLEKNQETAARLEKTLSTFMSFVLNVVQGQSKEIPANQSTNQP